MENRAFQNYVTKFDSTRQLSDEEEKCNNYAVHCSVKPINILRDKCVGGFAQYAN